MQVLVCARNELVSLLYARIELVSLLCARTELVFCARTELVSLLCATLLNGRDMLGRLCRVDLLNSNLPDDYTLVLIS